MHHETNSISYVVLLLNLHSRHFIKDTSALHCARAKSETKRERKKQKPQKKTKIINKAHKFERRIPTQSVCPFVCSFVRFSFVVCSGRNENIHFRLFSMSRTNFQFLISDTTTIKCVNYKNKILDFACFWWPALWLVSDSRFVSSFNRAWILVVVRRSIGVPLLESFCYYWLKIHVICRKVTGVSHPSTERTL